MESKGLPPGQTSAPFPPERSPGLPTGASGEPEAHAVVVILQEHLPRYRLSFFSLLDTKLAERGIDLRLVFGSAPDTDVADSARASMRHAVQLPTKERSVWKHRVVFQPTAGLLVGADLVIVEQASRFVLNYALMAKRRVSRSGLALWGHGWSRMESRSSRLGEALKRRLVRQSDWWFAYTDGVADYLEGLGYERECMTSVMNATDTACLRSLSSTYHLDIRSECGLSNAPVVLVLGSLYAERRIAMLFDTIDELHRLLPLVQVAIVGDGPAGPEVADRAMARPWVHVLGHLREERLAAIGSVSSLSLNVGVIGLGILDSFAMGLPLVAGELPGHGPEIDYLIDGVNGVLLPPGTDAVGFAVTVARIIEDEERRTEMAQEARATAAELTIENMAERFADGVVRALRCRSENASGYVGRLRGQRLATPASARA